MHILWARNVNVYTILHVMCIAYAQIREHLIYTLEKPYIEAIVDTTKITEKHRC